MSMHRKHNVIDYKFELASRILKRNVNQKLISG